MNIFVFSSIQRGLTFKDAGGYVRESKIQRTPDEVRALICAEYRRNIPGHGYQALAKKFGLSLSMVVDIVRQGDS